MATTYNIETSSEDEDNVYLNAAKVLRAMKNKKLSQCDNQVIEKPSEKLPENPPPTSIEKPREVVRPRRTRASTRRSGRKKRGQNQASSEIDDADLEIVSVEHPTKETPVITQSKKEVIIGGEILDSSEDEKRDIRVKVLWKSRNLHYFSIEKKESFRRVFQHFADLEGVPIDDILLTKKDKIIKKSDTPASLNLSLIDILEGGVVKKTGTTEETIDEDICVIKVQTTNKKKLTVMVQQDESFQKLWEKCAKELNVDESKLKFYFDGEMIAITDTPTSLDIEDEACFDLRISS